MAKHSMVDGIVFRAIGRKMTNSDRLSKLIGQMLKLFPKQRDSITIAASCVSQQQDWRVGSVVPFADAIPPSSYRIDGLLSGVESLSEIHHGFIALKIINSIRNHFAPT